MNDMFVTGPPSTEKMAHCKPVGLVCCRRKQQTSLFAGHLYFCRLSEERRERTLKCGGEVEVRLLKAIHPAGGSTRMDRLYFDMANTNEDIETTGKRCWVNA
jgi:hypothetical protein